MIKLEMIGFHATSQNNVNSIIEEGFKINKKRCNEWLGYGIYLFKYSVDACSWGKGTHYCKPNPKIIRCCVRVEKDKYLDLNNPEKLNEYDEYYKELLKTLSRENKVVRFKNKEEAMCWGLNIYKEDKKIDLIEYTFTHNRTKNLMKYTNNKNGYNYNETQMCVSSNSVIIKRELYS